MFSRILKIYLILFVSFFIGYSYLHYLFVKEINSLGFDNFYVSYLIPIVIVSILTFILYRPIIKQLTINKRELEVLIWIIIPHSIAIPIGVSQGYFREMNSRVIEITTPDEVMLYPDEIFFTIQKYYIHRSEFSAFQEQKSGRGSNLSVCNYYIVPLYTDSISRKFKVTCGIYYSTTVNNGLFFLDEVDQRIDEFNNNSVKNILDYNFSDIKFFERQIDKDQISNFQSAWMYNKSREQTKNPVVLVPQQEEFTNFLSGKRNIAVITTIISLIVAILFLCYLRVKYDL